MLPVVVPATFVGAVYAARQSCSGAFTIAGHDDEEGYLLAVAQSGISTRIRLKGKARCSEVERLIA